MSDKLMPSCIGHYDRGDSVCDGDKQGETEEEIMPCVYRDRCAAFKEHCAKKKYSVDQFVKIIECPDQNGDTQEYAVAKGDQEKFASRMLKWVGKFRIVNGRVGGDGEESAPSPKKKKSSNKKLNDPKDRKGPSASARNKAKKAISKKVEESNEAAYELCAWFTKCLEEATGRKVVDRPSANNGQFFVVDRMENSRYMAVYCRKQNDGKIPIVSLHPKARTNTCQVKFAANVKDFDGLSEVDKMGLVPVNDASKFNCRSVALDKEKLSIAAEKVSTLIEHGIIELPSE